MVSWWFEAAGVSPKLLDCRVHRPATDRAPESGDRPVAGVGSGIFIRYAIANVAPSISQRGAEPIQYGDRLGVSERVLATVERCSGVTV